MGDVDSSEKKQEFRSATAKETLSLAQLLSLPVSQEFKHLAEMPLPLNQAGEYISPGNGQ